MFDDPLSHAIQITLNNNAETSKHVREMTNNDVAEVETGIEDIKSKVISLESNRVKLYNTINSDFLVHQIYKSKIKLMNVKESHGKDFESVLIPYLLKTGTDEAEVVCQ